MKPPDKPRQARSTRNDMVMLMLASIACAFVLTVGLVQTDEVAAESLRNSKLILAGLIAGCGAITTFLIWRSLKSSRTQLKRKTQQVADLQKRLAMVEAVIGAEPQTLLFWGQPSRLQVISHTLENVPGLPASPTDLLKFADWLDPTSVGNLKAKVSALLGGGTAFTMIIKTKAGAPLEVDGRAAGGRAVIRIRDVAGYKRDISRIIDEHHQLAREISSSRALMNALPSPAWLSDDQGALLWVNEAYARDVEVDDTEQVIDQQVQLLEQRHRASAAEALNSGETFTKRLALLLEGRKRPHDVTVIGHAGRAAGVAVDVGALESAKGELDKQVEAFDRTLDRVATAVAIYDRNRQLVFFNEAFQSLWNLEPAWLNARPTVSDVLDRLRTDGRLPEVINYRQWKASFLREPEDGKERDDWWHTPDGLVVHVVVEQRLDGGVTHLYVNETERLDLERKFNALGRVQSETIDSLKEGVAVFATDGRLKLHNAAFATIWKFNAEELAGEPHIDAVILQIEQRFSGSECWPEIKTIVTALSDQRGSFEGQETRVDNVVLDYATTPLPDGATLTTFADVTASKRFERALRERNDALVVADRLKNQFIGHVSYELRTPLTNIIGFSEMLASPAFGDLSPKQREYVSDISSSSQVLLAIIDDILDLVTIDAGSLELDIEAVDARDILDRVLLAMRERATLAGLTFDIAVADDVVAFRADAKRVRQILYNLLSNAVGFSKQGDEVFITCWSEAGEVIFQVQDHGVGIPEEAQQRVFDRFESHSRGMKHRGAGLGLSLARSLVDLHGGSLSLQSAQGVGTRVTVRFPAAGPSVQQPLIGGDGVQDGTGNYVAARRAP